MPALFRSVELKRMESFNVGQEGSALSQPVMSVSEPGPGVVIGKWGEQGTLAHLVNEPGPGVQTVFFENGPPPGSLLMFGGPGPGGPPHDPSPERLLLLLEK